MYFASVSAIVAASMFNVPPTIIFRRKGIVATLSMWVNVVMLKASAGFPLNSSVMKATETPAGAAVAIISPANAAGLSKLLKAQAISGVISRTVSDVRYIVLCVNAFFMSVNLICRQVRVIKVISRYPVKGCIIMPGFGSMNASIIVPKTIAQVYWLKFCMSLLMYASLKNCRVGYGIRK